MIIDKYDKRPKNEFIKDTVNKRRKYRLKIEKYIIEEVNNQKKIGVINIWKQEIKNSKNKLFSLN